MITETQNKGKRLQIAVVSPGFLPVPAIKGGAVEVLTSYLLEGFDKEENISFDVYTVPAEELLNPYHKGEVIQVIPKLSDRVFAKAMRAIQKISRSQWRTSAYDLRLASLLREKQYDMVLVENNMNLFHAVFRGTKNQNNLFFHLHNEVLETDGAKTPEKCRFVGSHARRFLCVSRYIENGVITACPKANTAVLYNCISPEKYKKNTEERTVRRKEYGIDEDDIVILFSGRIDADKGVLELVRAFRRLEKENRGVKLLIVGSHWFSEESGQELAPYEKQVIAAGRGSKNIIFTGYVHPAEMPGVYSAADIVAVPSVFEEPFGVVALEAMASRNAIISTLSGGLAEILDDTCAIKADREGLEENLYEGLQALVNDTGLRESIADKGYESLYNRPEFDLQNYYLNFKKLVTGITE